MSLNKFLCKHFDKEKKGYVTFGDFLREYILIKISEIKIAKCELKEKNKAIK